MLSKKLKELRNEAGLTQEQAAEKLGVALKMQSTNEIET